MYYECHITVNPFGVPFTHPTTCEQAVPSGWSYSCIKGDPILGKTQFQYATKHFESDVPFLDVMKQMERAAQALRNQGWPVVREKIELVLFDSKH